jgi:pimeloyl-ACP methyl ester carboxylesterase
MGGSVAGAYAGAHPEQVAGLLLADPSGDSTQMPVEEVRQYLDALASEAYTNVVEGYWRQLLSGGAETTEVKVMQDLRNTSKATVVGILRELYKYNPVPALKRFDGPRLSIISSHSENPLALQNLVSDLPYQKITGTGHWLQLDKPEEFNRKMDDFLASIGSGSLH